MKVCDIHFLTKVVNSYGLYMYDIQEDIPFKI